MYAIAVAETGGPDVLTFVEKPIPTPGPEPRPTETSKAVEPMALRC